MAHCATTDSEYGNAANKPLDHLQMAYWSIAITMKGYTFLCEESVRSQRL